METIRKERYEMPSATVVKVKTKGIICLSEVLNETEAGLEDYILNEPLDW